MSCDFKMNSILFFCFFHQISVFSDLWFTKDINVGHMEYLFFLFAAIMLVDFLFFLLLSKCLKFKRPEEKIEKDIEISVINGIQNSS